MGIVMMTAVVALAVVAVTGIAMMTAVVDLAVTEASPDLTGMVMTAVAALVTVMLIAGQNRMVSINSVIRRPVARMKMTISSGSRMIKRRKTTINNRVFSRERGISGMVSLFLY